MDKQLNVCLLNDSFPPKIDGVANVMLNYAKVIQNNLGNAVVVTPRYPGVSYDYPFPVVSYLSVKTPKTAGYRTGIPLQSIVREIASYPIDIIHCHCPFVSAIIAKNLRAVTGAPIILTYHTKFDVDIAKNFNSTIMQSTAKKVVKANINACDEIWAVSQGAGGNLKSLGYDGSFIIMENGVDFPKGPAAEELISAVSSETGLPNDVPVFLYVGRMMWYKGIRLLLDGLYKAKAEGARFKMVFVGGGTDFEDIEKLACELGLEGECMFIGPINDREVLRAFYSRADMFLFPSSYDTNGLVVREAAACGSASVLVKGSPAAESVTDGKNAVLIDENADSLADTIVKLSANTEYMKTLGNQAMDDLYLPWDVAVSRAYERYFKVLGTKGK